MCIIGATAAQTWTNPQTQFMSGGISSIYQNFKATMAMKIGTSNPAKDMTTLYTYLEHLRANQVVIPEYIQGMMLLNVVPNKWDHVVAYYVQQQQMVNTITFTAIQTAILAEFEHSGGNHNHQSHTADKISVVKRKGKSPNFQKKKATADNDYTAEQEAGPSQQKKCHANHCSKKGKGGGGNSHQHSQLANRLEKVELGQL